MSIAMTQMVLRLQEEVRELKADVAGMVSLVDALKADLAQIPKLEREYPGKLHIPPFPRILRELGYLPPEEEDAA